MAEQRSGETTRVMAAANPHQLRRRWDAFDAYLFDIDGTLLHCKDAVHYFALCEALQQISGRSLNLDGVTAHGNTDIGILRDALHMAGVSEVLWRPRLPDICTQMADFVERKKAELCVSVMPGVPEVLQHLQRRGALLGVATGNLERIGRLKLGAGGLLDYFTLGGFSDAYEYRRDVFRGALEQVREALGSSASICVVGDTPADVQAAAANQVDVIAVATGVYSFEELAAERPSCCVRSLDELLSLL